MVRAAAYDVLRLFAFFSVFGFHLIGASDISGLSSWFQYGYLGVYFFFFLSGTLILQSFCNNKSTFLRRRFLRIWPVWLISLLFVGVISLFDDNDIVMSDYVMHLLFIHPSIGSFLGIDGDYVDGVFWTMFVEIYFYISFALFFSYCDANKRSIVFLLIFNLFFIFLSKFIFAELVTSVLKVAGFFYFPFFLLGCFFKYVSRFNLDFIFFVLSVLISSVLYFQIGFFDLTQLFYFLF